MMPSFKIRFYDAGEDPEIYIINDYGMKVVKIFEVPTLKKGIEWSWNESDWKPGPLAAKIMRFLESQEAPAALMD